jgi:hypothetical protein
MSKQFKRSVPHIDLNVKFSFAFNTCDSMDLPLYDDAKKHTCPGQTQVKDVINFAHGKIHFDKHIICDPASSRDFNPLKYIEMTLPFIKNPAAHGETQTYEFIRLPQQMHLGIIYKLLWPLTGMPNCE